MGAAEAPRHPSWVVWWVAVFACAIFRNREIPFPHEMAVVTVLGYVMY